MIKDNTDQNPETLPILEFIPLHFSGLCIVPIIFFLEGFLGFVFTTKDLKYKKKAELIKKSAKKI